MKLIFHYRVYLSNSGQEWPSQSSKKIDNIKARALTTNLHGNTRVNMPLVFIKEQFNRTMNWAL